MGDKKVMVSVIIPIYNVEDYLRDCLDSILAQTYEDFEAILVDDGSTDSSGNICDAYAEKEPRIKVIHKKNGGLSSARNAGIDIAKGEFIAFVDSDDAVHPDYLNTMVELAEKHSSDLVACGFVTGEACVWEESDDALDIRIGREILNRVNDNDVVVTVAWNKLYSRKFFDEYKLRYPEGKIHEDMFLTPQILYRSNKMVITDQKLYFYRQRPNSIMTAKFSLKQLDILEAIEFRIDFFKANGYKELTYTEYENYIRKLRQLYLKMKKSDAEKYSEELKQIQKKAKSILGNVEVFLHLGWKYKIKLLNFVLLNK